MNYSGSTKRNTIERKEISIRPRSDEIIVDKKNIEDEIEMKSVMELFEKIKEEKPEIFHKVMLNLKKIIDIFSLEKCCMEELKLLDELFTEVETINKDFLFWCVNKGIKIAIIEYKNIEIAHFIFIKKNYKLKNKSIHKNILIQNKEFR